LITTVPANPVAGVPFVVNVTTSGCIQSVSSAVNGTTIDITLHPKEACVTEPGMTFSITVGPLPAGTYTIRALDEQSLVLGTAPLVITADVPVLDLRALAVLVIALMVIAILRLR
jgi:hypothetical protein